MYDDNYKPSSPSLESKIQTHQLQADSASDERLPVVFAKDGHVFANSRDVAAFFRKEVKHVHEAIRNLIAKEPSTVSAFFRPFKIKDLSGESIHHYEMNRDGFTLLAMGFTGKKALEFKVRYIAAFNAMEAKLKEPYHGSIDYSDPQILLGVLTHLKEESAKKDVIIAEQSKSVRALERLEAAEGEMCITDAAKTLDVKVKWLFLFMASKRWIYKRPGNRNWIAYADKMPHYLRHDDHLYIDSLGQERVATRVIVTAKGLVALAKLLDKPLNAKGD